ncbi:hypothetical protein DPMN_033194 [Dreissena polymorpha]|uniref:Uncharacterized protein n=1 Tax=Dreissena polymorpha TaxID=45954 RepID=A0A9D4RIN1_DREPO|nr:hypothetical protein DPMN_033194 [Dreissena polymorpha]
MLSLLGAVFQRTGTIFYLSPDIIRTNFFAKFHEDWTKMYYYSHEKCPAPGSHENFPPAGSHVFQQTGTIFELIQDIIKTNVLSKFHEDWTTNVTFKVLKRKNALTPAIIGKNLLTKFH